MKIGELIIDLEKRRAEKGDVDIYVSAGDDGMEMLERTKWVRARPAKSEDYFPSHDDKADKQLHSVTGIRGLGRFAIAEDNENHVVGVYLGI